MNKVEQVARALAGADGMHPEAVSNDEDEVPVWTLYVPGAIAALKAMREPTEAMVEMGAVQSCGAAKEQAVEWAKLDKFEGYELACRDIFTAMIDASLSEAGETNEQQ